MGKDMIRHVGFDNDHLSITGKEPVTTGVVGA